jgi:hypothetical protein
MFPYNTGLNALEIGIWMFSNLIQLMRKKLQLLPETAGFFKVYLLGSVGPLQLLVKVGVFSVARFLFF